MTWLIRYWRPLAALALIACALSTGWVTRGWKDRAQHATELQKAIDAIEDANLKAEKANVALIAELRKPKAGVEIREIVRDNPSQCVLPKPVFDGLLRNIREANAAR